AVRQPAADPADHGPSEWPKTPRAAIVARISSVSKNSATKSATAMGPHRSKSKIRFLPRPRTPRPVLNRFHKSSGVGLSIAGGVIELSCAKTAAISSSALAHSLYLSASFAEARASPPAVFAASE